MKDAYIAIGEALFFAEGGRIRNELIYEPLSALEHRLFAWKFGLEPEAWQTLQSLASDALNNGAVNRLRKDVLREFYGHIEGPTPRY